MGQNLDLKVHYLYYEQLVIQLKALLIHFCRKSLNHLVVIKESKGHGEPCLYDIPVSTVPHFVNLS